MDIVTSYKLFSRQCECLHIKRTLHITFYTLSGNDEEVKVTSTDTFSRWQEIQTERRQRIKKACQKYTSLNMTDTFFSDVLVDDVHRVIYTPIPKAACSSWKWLLLALLAGYNISQPEILGPSIHLGKVQEKHGLRKLARYKLNERRVRLENYTKLLAVRHPLARVLSAYYDKLKYHLHQSGGYKCAYCKEVGADIVLSHGGTIHNGLEINVTLNDFLGRLTEPDKIGYANPHWTEISDIALPCLVDYDYIVKTETILEDTRHILRHIFHSNVTFPHKHMLHQGERSDVPLKNIATEIKQKLKTRYKFDMELFGYDFDVISSHMLSY